MYKATNESDQRRRSTLRLAQLLTHGPIELSPQDRIAAVRLACDKERARIVRLNALRDRSIERLNELEAERKKLDPPKWKHEDLIREFVSAAKTILDRSVVSQIFEEANKRLAERPVANKECVVFVKGKLPKSAEA